MAGFRKLLLGKRKPTGKTRIIVVVPDSNPMDQATWDRLQGECDPNKILESEVVHAAGLHDRNVRKARTRANQDKNVRQYFLVFLMDRPARTEEEFEIQVEAYVQHELEKPEVADLVEGYRSEECLWAMTSMREGHGTSYSAILVPHYAHGPHESYSRVIGALLEISRSM